MRKILTIFLLLACSLVAEADKWYIATTGSDTHGKGTLADPWLTLKHATDTVTGANFVGDTIVVGVGTFTETAQINLGVGVSIYGAGATSIISSTVAYEGTGNTIPTIQLVSAVEGTDGSQSISYLAFDGNSYTADVGIAVWLRKNVVIHHVDMVDCHYSGIQMTGAVGAPTTYATGNEIHDCNIYDCGGPNASYGNVQIGAQSGMKIYNNTIEQPQRTGYNQAGFGIKYFRQGHLHGLKIYNNTIICEEGNEYDEWQAAIELFGCEGGLEIYGNYFEGTMDFSDFVGSPGTSDTEGYGYAVKIYDNFSNRTTNTVLGAQFTVFERETKGGVYIYNNLIKNVAPAITFANPANGVTEDIYIYYNIFHSLGTVASKEEDGGIMIGRFSDALTVAYDNINILNNVFIDNSVGEPNYGIRFRGGVGITYDNINIKNNIIKDFTTGIGAGISFSYVTCNNLNIENNCINGCTADILKTDCTITNDVTQNNITVDPEFLSSSDFHLQSTSPARDAGIDVSAITGGLDFHGASLYGAAYDIGAFEYGVGRMMILNDSIMPTINYKTPLIEH